MFAEGDVMKMRYLFSIAPVLFSLAFLVIGCGGGNGGNGAIVDGDKPTILALGENGSITIQPNALPDNTQIDITKTAIPILPEALEAVGTAYYIDTDANLTLPAIVKLPVPEGENADEMAIVRIEESGIISILQTSVENGLLVARTPGFSHVTPARLKGALQTIKPKIVGPDILPPDLVAQYFESQFVEIPGLNRKWQAFGYGIAQDDINLTMTDEPLKNNGVTLRVAPGAVGAVDLMVDLIEPSTGINVVALKNIVIQEKDATGSTDLDINIISPLIVDKNESFILVANILNLGDDSEVSWSWELQGGNSGTQVGRKLATSPQQLGEQGVHTLTVTATTEGREGNATFDILVIGDIKIHRWT